MTARAPEYTFSDILQNPAVRERWEKVRKFFFLRESTYDMTNRCNIRCEGCYYFNGEKQSAIEKNDPREWRRLLAAEKERGITFVVLAGAEPSLVPELCAACYEVIPLGAIATNGLKKIPPEIDYRIHISVWGNDRTSLAIRKAPDMLARQIANYAGDPRAVWVYTFTPVNIDEAREVTELLAENGLKITFNMFSAPVGYSGHLRHTPETLARTRQVMTELLAEFPETVLFSPYNIAVPIPRRRGCTNSFPVPIRAAIRPPTSGLAAPFASTAPICAGTARPPAACRTPIAMIAAIMPPAAPWSPPGCTAMPLIR